MAAQLSTGSDLRDQNMNSRRANDSNPPQFNSKYTEDTLGKPKQFSADVRHQSIDSAGSSPTSTRHPSRAINRPISPSNSTTSLLNLGAPKAKVQQPGYTSNIDTSIRRSSTAWSPATTPTTSSFNQIDKSLGEKPPAPTTQQLKSKKIRRPTGLFNRFMSSRRESDPQSHSYKRSSTALPTSKLSMTRKSDPTDDASMSNQMIDFDQVEPEFFNQNVHHVPLEYRANSVSDHNYKLTSRVPPSSATARSSSHSIPQQMTALNRQSTVPLPQRASTGSHPGMISSSPDLNKKEIKIQQPFGIDLGSDNEDLASITKLSDSAMSRMGSMASVSVPGPMWRAPESWKVKTTTDDIPNDKSVAPSRGLSQSDSSTSVSTYSSTSGLSDTSPDAHKDGADLTDHAPRSKKKSVSSTRDRSESYDPNGTGDLQLSTVPSLATPPVTMHSTAAAASNSAPTPTSTSPPTPPLFPKKNKSISEADDAADHHHHHHHAYHPKEVRGAARSSVRIFKGDKTSVLPCTLDTTCKDILDVLRRKRFLKFEDDHIIVLKCGGLVRVLSLDEKPLKIQRNMLFLYGYNERDNLDYIERTDLGFLFKFVVQDRGVELISKEKRRMINPQNVNLKNWNLQDIPNFLYAEPIVSLDVSQNPSFEFTKEFMHDCRNLLTLNFTRNGNPKFPACVVYAPRLMDLDLEVNYIKSIPPEIAMLKTLTTLNLACNRLFTLPDSFSELQNLKILNLSSNRFKSIPDPVMKIQGLQRLDLAYNSISVLSEQMVNLASLEVLQLSANKLAKTLPDFFSQFASLIKLDIRFNRFDSIDALKDLPKLEVIRATGNNVSVFTSGAKNLFEVELNINPVTYVKFLQVMTKLKIVDFSKGKITSCSFVSMLPAVEKLTLDNNHLVSLPDEIANMRKLQYLSIFKNNITALPNAIGKLTKLKYLDLHLNNISVLTSTIWKLESLEYLNVSSNLLESFPDPPQSSSSPFNGIPTLGKLNAAKGQKPQLGYQQTPTSSSSANEEAVDINSLQLPQLETHPLSLSAIKRRGSELSNSGSGSFSKELGGLERSLKILSMNDNKLTDATIHTISIFKNLEFLNLSYNELFDIPSGYLNNLTKLHSLYLSGNHLSSLPVEDFDSFTEMTTLHLNGNRFHTLPAELSKIKNLTSLDVGSNNLKYNIGNIPYDWNWCQNVKLNYLNFSGNKRLEIKPQHKRDGMEDSLDSFLVLKNMKLLGLMDVTITTDAVPDQGVDVRVRSTVSQLGKFGYGISDTLGEKSSLSTRDVVIEKFRGQADELLITIYDGKNCSDNMGDRISKIIQETFEIHLAKELETVGTSEVAGHEPKTVEDALRGAFLTMNSEMNILINRDRSSTFSSAAAHRTTTTDELTLEQDGLTGCCATVIYIKGDILYVANIGDTMGLMTKSDGEYSILTAKHEPYAPEEYERIRESGGYVTTDGYLDGVSDVSRAVGFFKLIPHINASPSISQFKLTQNEEMIVIATSEIWKKVPYDLAADIIRQEKSNPGVAAEKLRDFAISYGAHDKCTAVVLSLRQFQVKQKQQERSSLPEDSILRKLDEEIEPPTGELAMVFTDIKNSTLLWDAYPVAMRSAIKIHNAIMRRQLRIIGGYEVKTEGDAFMVAFPTPTSALLWCFTVQSQLLTTTEWPAEILASDQGFEIKDENDNIIYRGLSVRMGVHWGRPVCERDIVTKRMDYFGPMVNRASRVSSVADGGQITMSTDFYYEFEKLKKLHEKVDTEGSDLAEVYGSKMLGQILEIQMNQLDQIGWVEESIGAKKLKGLETPEKIWLIFPSQLSSRLKVLTNSNGQVNNKSNKLVIGGITTETIWKLRKISLRLEIICSQLTSESSQNSVKHSRSDFAEDLSKQAEDAMNSQLNSTEIDLMVFIEHIVTRIENSVTILATRKLCGSNETGLSRCSVDDLYGQLHEMFEQLKSIGGLNQRPISNQIQEI
ncbi:hypothetical protein CANARDRAFT_29171 [[Candida] arabinofermentans NRRL YB-2248]|uniref:Adenylate cyclase n=1 Tax=[Candida] arabinofermentans NRRL YB-2248 TaxID=983967 RepID=A0A1E4SXR6_9ASCO|nr:hypothetical protein CANARDRAFT_29171 [[Candida] arabinofermentans NRRL YB-2248]